MTLAEIRDHGVSQGRTKSAAAAPTASAKNKWDPGF